MTHTLTNSALAQLDRLGARTSCNGGPEQARSDDEASTSSTNTSISLLDDLQSPTGEGAALGKAQLGGVGLIPPLGEVTPLSALERLLDLRQTSHDTFVNTGELFSPYRSGTAGTGLFGGTMVAQATLAALRFTNTAHKRWKPISLQCHFLHAAHTHPALCYRVLPLKEGKNYCTREVSLYQNERLIYRATVTLQAYKLNGSAANMTGQLYHQHSAPVEGVDIAPPEEMHPHAEVFEAWAKHAANVPHLEHLKGPKAQQEMVRCYNREPIEWRLPMDMFELNRVSAEERKMDPAERTLRYWVRTKDALAEPDVFSWVALAYISDYFFLSTNMRLNMHEMFTTKFSVSLDHTIYFNHQIDPSQFFSYNVRSLKSGENRSIMMGEMFTREGDLAATTVQEGLSVVFND